MPPPETDFGVDPPNIAEPQSLVDQNLGQLMAAPGGGPPDDPGSDVSDDEEEDEEEGEDAETDDGSDAESNVMVVLEPDHVSTRRNLYSGKTAYAFLLHTK